MFVLFLLTILASIYQLLFILGIGSGGWSVLFLLNDDAYAKRKAMQFFKLSILLFSLAILLWSLSIGLFFYYDPDTAAMYYLGNEYIVAKSASHVVPNLKDINLELIKDVIHNN